MGNSIESLGKPAAVHETSDSLFLLLSRLYSSCGRIDEYDAKKVLPYYMDFATQPDLADPASDVAYTFIHFFSRYADHFTPDAKLIFTTPTEALITTREAPPTLTNAFFALKPEYVTAEVARAIKQNLQPYSLSARVSFAGTYDKIIHNEPIDFFANTDNAEWVSSPEQILAKRDVLEYGDHFMLDQSELTPQELQQLLAISEERYDEVMLLGAYGKLFYFVGNHNKVGRGKNAGETFSAFHERSIRLNLHSHPPRRNGLVINWQSEPDRRQAKKYELSRDFIGWCPKRKDAKWKFQEFDKTSRAINPRSQQNLETMTKIINQIAQSPVA